MFLKLKVASWLPKKVNQCLWIRELGTIICFDAESEF